MAATTTDLNPATVPGGNKIAGDTLTTVNGAAAPSGAVAHYAKLAHGAAGELKDATPAQPVPTADQALPALLGPLNAAAAASDTADAPTNGILKRIAQNVTSTITALGTKVTAVTALGAGGVGVIGWLSQVWDVLQSRLPALSSGRVPVDGSGVTQPVSATALPLPTGAATAALQTALNDKVPALVSGRMPVDGSGVTQPVSFTWAGLTDTQLRASAVPVSGTFFQATQPVSATSLPLPTGAATAALQTALNDKVPAPLNNRMPTEPLGIPGVSRTQVAGVSTNNVVLTTGIRAISIHCRGANARYVVGSSLQTANATTSHFIADGERLDLDVPATANIAVIRNISATADATIEITELS